MIASSLLSNVVPVLKKDDTCAQALGWMDLFRVSHLRLCRSALFPPKEKRVDHHHLLDGRQKGRAAGCGLCRDQVCDERLFPGAAAGAARKRRPCRDHLPEPHGYPADRTRGLPEADAEGRPRYGRKGSDPVGGEKEEGADGAVLLLPPADMGGCHQPVVQRLAGAGQPPCRHRERYRADQ